jgi:photosystem I subunit 3
LVLGAVAASAVAVTFVAGPIAGAPRVFRTSLAAFRGEEPFALQEDLVSEGAPPARAQEVTSGLRWLGAGLAAGLLLAASAAPQPAAAEIDYSQFQFKNWANMVPCKDSKKYHKKFKDEVYKSQQRQKKYPKGGVVWNRWEAKIAQTKRVEEGYGTRLCSSKDGLPRTIASGELNVRGSIVIPSLIFLYTAGWIGWAGRAYLIRTQDKMKEIQIDVPLAVVCMASGFAWPVAAWQDIVNGKFVLKDEDVYTSGGLNFPSKAP